MLKINGKFNAFALQDSLGDWKVYGTKFHTYHNGFSYVADLKSYQDLLELADDTPIYASCDMFFGKYNHEQHYALRYTNKHTFMINIDYLVIVFYKQHADLSQESVTLNAVRNVIIQTVIDNCDGMDFDELIDRIEDDIDRYPSEYARDVAKEIRKTTR